METQLAQLRVPGFSPIQAPPSIPTGGAGTLGQIITVALSVLTVGAIIISIGVIIWGAFAWITSQGDKQKLEKARKTIMYAIAGLIITFLSLFILRFVSDILGTGLYTP